ncbi:MAG: hypothetical protein ABIO91_06565, partial [Pyrinomonadaceae bacterium]
MRNGANGEAGPNSPAFFFAAEWLLGIQAFGHSVIICHFPGRIVLSLSPKQYENQKRFCCSPFMR